MPSPSVLIVGAGPVGLTTALCLQQGGVPARDILIVDQRLARETSHMWSKALSMSASSLEIFRTLGIADRLIELGTPLYEAHFGGGPQRLSLNYDVIGTKYSFNLQLPQLRTEGVLLKRCEEVGVRFSWGLRFSSFSHTGTGVSASFHNLKPDVPSAGAAEELETIEATWLIGCDEHHITEENEDALLNARDQGVFILAAMSGSKETRAGDLKAIVKATGHGDQVHVLETPLVASGDKWNSVAALLIRPDFRVAWVASSDTDIKVNETSLAKVLQWWLG